MSAGTVAKSILRSIFSWKMLFMLIGSAIVFGGVFCKIFSGFAAMAEQMASMPAPVVNVTAQPVRNAGLGCRSFRHRRHGSPPRRRRHHFGDRPRAADQDSNPARKSHKDRRWCSSTPMSSAPISQAPRPR